MDCLPRMNPNLLADHLGSKGLLLLIGKNGHVFDFLLINLLFFTGMLHEGERLEIKV
jgi:hypothetical protein